MTETLFCRCGCQLPVEIAYKPGHDARHAGTVARAAAEAAAEQNISLDHPELFKALPSEALRAKARKHAASILSKEATRAERKAAKAAKRRSRVSDGHSTHINGFVKMGRWEYPAVQYSDGRVERNTKRDGSGTWSPSDASKFRPLDA